MKKFILFITITAAIAVAMTACNSHPAQQVSYVDTTGFAQFQAWKAMNDQQTTAVVPVAKKRTSTVNKSSSMSSSTTNSAMTTKKKGWSKGAKYAAIGGGSGAVLGAVINKRNRVAGGVVGAILGGGIGYVFGHSKDKKDGRL